MIEIVFSREIVVPAKDNLAEYAKALTSNDSIKLSLRETTYSEAVEGVPGFDRDAFEQFSNEKLRLLQESDSENV